MSTTPSSEIPMVPRSRHVERESWVPALGPGMILGALGTLGLVISFFMAWRTPGVHPSEIPFAFLFDSGTTAQDPSVLLGLIPMAVLLGVGTVFPSASAARIVGALGAAIILILFAIQLGDQVGEIPGANLGDALSTGFYVAAMATLVGAVSAFLPSGWTRRHVSSINTADPVMADRRDYVRADDHLPR